MVFSSSKIEITDSNNQNLSFQWKVDSNALGLERTSGAAAPQTIAKFQVDDGLQFQFTSAGVALKNTATNAVTTLAAQSNMTLNGTTSFDGPLVPKTTNAVDIGTTSLKFKDAKFAGVVTCQDILVNGVSFSNAVSDNSVTTSKIADAAVTGAKLASTIYTSNLGLGTTSPQAPLDVVGDGKFSGNVVVGGNLTINGTTTTIDTNTLLIEDNIITLNKNQTGTPATFLQSGIEVERGDAVNYLFVFDEASDLFKIGESNQLQAVATRDDALTTGYPYYDSATSKLTNKTFATSDFPDSIITTQKIADAGVTAVKLAVNAVSTASIADAQVTNAKLADGSVTAVKLATNAVSTASIADAQVTNAKLADGSVTAVKLAANAVETANIADAQVTNAKLANGSVTAVKLAANAVETASIANAQVTNAKLADGSVDGPKLSATMDNLGAFKFGSSGYIIPTTTNTSYVGSATNKFASGYFSNLDVMNLTINGSPLSASVSGGSGSGSNVWSTSGSNIYFSTSSNASSGSVGIGTTTPSYKLHVVGDVFSTGNITAFSDSRFKTDIVKIENALDKVLQVRGYTYKRTDQPDGPTYAGVLAHEIEKVLPEVVMRDSQGMASVAYGNVIALLIEAIHDMKKEIEDLKFR